MVQSPLSPPTYLTADGVPHRNGIFVHEPPVCTRCSDQPDSIAKLEQHVRVSKTPESEVNIFKRQNHETEARVSLSDPLGTRAGSLLPESHSPHLRPPWMALLPSNRTLFVQQWHRAVFKRRSTFPSYKSSRLSTPSINPQITTSLSDTRLEPLGRPFLNIRVDRISVSTPTLSTTARPTFEDVGETGPLSKRRDSNNCRRISDNSQSNSSRGTARPNLWRTSVRSVHSRDNVGAEQHGEAQLAPQPRQGKARSVSQLFKRNNSAHKRRLPLHETSVPTIAAASISHGLIGVHGTNPSQMAEPVKAPFLKELSGFFAHRTGK